MIYQFFQNERIKRGGPIDRAASPLDDPTSLSVLTDMRRVFLGDRLCFATTGAAPTAPHVAAFLERCFEIQVVDTYGSTEFGRVTVNGRIQPWVSYKLADVPELGYTSRDQPHPRGELLIKSSRETPGYFRNPEASSRLRDVDGYVLSGDIVEERGPGHIVWIDRKHSTIRLAQGAFVNVARLEDLFPAESPLIEQIYVYGNSLRSYVLAAVVPNREAIATRLDAGEMDPAAVKRLLRNEIDHVAKISHLASHEVPRDFIVEMQPFSRENGLLTEASKPKRPQLRATYGTRLEALYTTIEARQLGVPVASESATVAEQVLHAVASVLGLELASLDPEQQSFVRLGGDSFGAVQLSALVKESCGISLAVSMILDPSATLSAVTRAAQSLVGASSAVTFEQIHGKDAAWARARDLRIDRFVAPEILDRAATLRTSDAIRTILLTGANGYLGRFLLLELLEHARANGGRIACVVRAGDDAAALRRVRAPFERAGGDLLKRFEALSEGARLAVHAGDLIRPDLGLASGAFARLTEEVDAIVHNGALVNHALSYPHLFGPNVAGTANIARFSILERIKQVSFVSTVGVAAGLRRTAPILETEDAALLWSRRPVRAEHSDYALGYSTSKWACEIMLKSLAATCAVPVNIFRCGMILPHSTILEQFNDGDAFVRLLYGIVRTGIAPASFYDPEYRYERHYDGLPVDFVARAIAGVATRPSDPFQIYHVSNSNWGDGISLDTLVDWAAGAGLPLVRLPYAEWYEEFRRRLDGLSESEKRRSPLAILGRWEHPISNRVGRLRMDTTSFRSMLGEGEIPSLGEEFIRRCWRFLADSATIEDRSR